jgi:hypothetical protein
MACEETGKDMKKKKLTRKERKRLLDEEMAKRGIDPDARRQKKESAASKMSWLSSFQSEKEASEAFAEMLVMSGLLADEPELEELLFDPMLSVNTLAEVVAELGLVAEGGDLSDWAISEDAQMDVHERVTARLLTKQSQRQFENAIAQLVKRLERTQEAEKLVIASAVQFFMKSVRDKAGWATLGLVQEIVRRSMDAGFKLLNFVDEHVSEGQSVTDVIRSLGEHKVTKTFESIVGKVPGLRSYLEKEADTVWEEGIEALENGKLNLELFSPEELQGGVDIIGEVLQLQIDGEAAREESHQPTLTEEQSKTFLTRLEEYVAGLFAPERLEQLRAHLDSYLGEPGGNRPYMAFISMVDLHMRGDNAVEDEIWLLMQSFFWEMRRYLQRESAREKGDQ